jgi:hypothetical protein
MCDLKVLPFAFMNGQNWLFHSYEGHHENFIHIKGITIFICPSYKEKSLPYGAVNGKNILGDNVTAK